MALRSAPCVGPHRRELCALAAAIDEFNSHGEYRGQLPQAMIDAEPSALAVDAKGKVYATSGNSEGAIVYGC